MGRSNFQPSKVSLAVLALSMTTLLTACGGSHDSTEEAKPSAQTQQQAPAIPVETVNLIASQTPNHIALTGRVRAFEEAEIRPQVTGIIKKRLFTEGQKVSAGDALYKIDDSEYRAEYNRALADLNGAEADAKAARQTAERFKSLSEINAVSRQEYDEALAAAQRADANIGIAQAALTSAEINLARTTIKSPIEGQIGRSSVTSGALITANQATALARVQRIDPVYVDLTSSASEVLRWKRQIARGELVTNANEKIPVTIYFDDNTAYPHQGELEFSEVNVDEESGTVIVRAVIPNPENLILPGMFVKAEFNAGSLQSVYLIPQKAVQRNLQGQPYVLVKNAQDIVEQRQITISGTSKSDWIVTSGLNNNDQLIVSGFMAIKEGAKVAAIQPKTDLAQAKDTSEQAQEL